MRVLKKIVEIILQKIKNNNFLFRCKFEPSKFRQFNIRTIDSFFNENLIVLKRNSNFPQSKSNYLSIFFLNKIFINKKIYNNSIKIKILKNVFCFPGPSFNCKAIYLKNNNLILSEGFDLKKEKLSLELHYENNQENMFKLDIKKNAFCFSGSWLTRRKSKKFESGINLLDSVNNYWHFLFEQAPKILLAQNSKIPKEVPILIPRGLHKNLYQILDILNTGEYKRDILKFKKFNLNDPLENEILEFKKIYHISDYIDFPVHLRGNIDSIKNSSKQKYTLNFNSYPIELLVTKIMSHFGFKRNADPNLKLVLRRDSSFRISKDQQKLEDFLIKKGFQIFNPSLLSFKDQVQICSKASYFIGFSGAGCSNCIFLPDDAKKIIFFNKTFVYLIPFWNQLLSNASLIDNEFISNEIHSDNIHGEPYLSDENWDFLRRNV